MKDRLFFAFSVKAPWPESFPEGRILKEENRHVTLVFLGDKKKEEVIPFTEKMPTPSMGMVGKCDELLFLPKKECRVAAWHIDWLGDDEKIKEYQNKLVQFLVENGTEIPEKKRSFLSHVTIARKPISQKDWKKDFEPVPCMIDAIHLYKSLGNSAYESLWKKDLILPFEEFEHTADIAFTIKGEDIYQLHKHAFIALAFAFPPFISFYEKKQNIESVDDIVMHLNELIFKADSKIGAPFKAVSFHGKKEKKDNLYQWELIVDV